VNDDTQITNLKEKFKMATFILLTRISSISIPTPRALEDLKRKVMDHVRTECPRAEWIHKFAVIGPYDYLDIFWAPDLDTALKSPRLSVPMAMHKRKFGRQPNGNNLKRWLLILPAAKAKTYD
jgi:hypothetical protein